MAFIKLPRQHRKLISAVETWSDLNRWASGTDDRIIEIIKSLEQSARVLAGLTAMTAPTELAPHAAQHLPNGSDPLATAAPTTVLGGTSTNAAGTANSFSRSNHSHDVETALHSGSYGTTALEGTGNAVLRADGRFVFPQSLLSPTTSTLLTLTDDGLNQTLTGDLGALKIRPSGEELELPKWTGSLESDLGTVLKLNPTTATHGTSLALALLAASQYNTATTYTGTKRAASITLIVNPSASVLFSGVTLRAATIDLGAATGGATAQTFTERSNLTLDHGGLTGTNISITDSFILKGMGWPTSGTGLYTNASSVQMLFPSIGAAIRRGYELVTNANNRGTEAPNTEGFYCGALQFGTTVRANFHAIGATTGTTSVASCFSQGTVHSVGTDRFGINTKNRAYFENPSGFDKPVLEMMQLSTGATGGAHVKLNDKAGDPPSPVAGELWRNGAALNYRKDGSTTVDLAAGGGAITSTEFFLDFGTREVAFA